MALPLVLLTAMLAFSLASTEQCVSSPGSSIDLTLRSHKNASGHWIITVETLRLTMDDDPREISVHVRQGTKICGRKEIQHFFSADLVYPLLHDTSMPGAIEPSTTRRTTTATQSTSLSTTTTPSTINTATSSTSAIAIVTPSTSTITTATPSTSTTTTASPSTTTTTSSTTSKSCPRPGYQPYPGFNCYKAFPSEGEMKTWSEARATCTGDGGDLMVIESERERKEVFIPLYKSVKFYYYPWVGVYIPQGGYNWTTVKGEPARSTWWRPGYPDKFGLGKCAQAYHTGLLMNWLCAGTKPFICEISL